MKQKNNSSEIDWYAQWKIHGHQFHDGYVHVELPKAISPYWKQLKLTPGPGFGDLSHPTTRLMIEMLKQYAIKDQLVIDIGCGSGILSLCAVALGAKEVYAIDIDKLALQHSRENARLNGMEDQIHFYSSDSFELSSFAKSPLVLMNMVMNEQKEAWQSLQSLHQRHGLCMVSGLLIEHREAYLNLVVNWGWNLIEECEEKGWLGLKFSPSFH